MTETKESIVNLALAELGSNQQISSFTANEKLPRIARSVYEPTVREVLRDHPWRFARRTAILSNDPAFDQPKLGWTSACSLPADFIRVVYVNERITGYARQGSHLLVDDEAPELTYVARVPENEFDPLFVIALALQLAARMCKAVTDSDSQKEGLTKDFRAKLADAKIADAVDGSPEEPPVSNMEMVRA